ncbi:FecR domain-containing protein [Galbibacter sp. PAP.153]|uniref:FecR family protein n=1 Tax=Galbibacter sp. PAP.153 TaxID=3104623 RepID=UPI00300858D2
MDIKGLDQISAQEKNDLKKRINNSIVRYRSRKKNQRKVIYYAAAVIGFMIIPSVILLIKHDMQQSAIEKYVSARKEKNIDNFQQDVQLRIGEENIIKLAARDTIVSYTQSASTNKIRVNNKVVYDTEHQTGPLNKAIYNSLEVPYGKHSFMTLSDGTKVWLNAGTVLTYPLRFSENKREVFLQGEAIFDVAHNKEKPFYVHTTNGKIRVLGTVFNVYSYPDESKTYTALLKGKVEAIYEKSTLLGTTITSELRPGMIASYDSEKKSVKVTHENVEPYMKWREGVLVFKNEKLESIINKIARYYNIKVKVNNQSSMFKTFSGSLDIKDSLHDIMLIIKETTAIDYTLGSDNTLLIN